MTKRARSWCSRQCSHSIDEKFEWEEDSDKRINIPEFYMLKSDLKYLNKLAGRKKLSPSACLEKMIDRYILKGWEFLECYTMEGQRRKRGARGLSSVKVKRRNYMIHPSMLSIVDKQRAAQGDISYSLFFERMIGEYKREYPVSF